MLKLESSALPEIEEAKAQISRARAGELLYDFWYPASPCSDLKRGQMRRQMLLDMPLLIGRDSQGQVFALDDHCPHRGIPLSFGSFDGTQIECCYHGWKFDCAGRCTEIPALLPDSPIKAEKIRARTYRSFEADGYLWVYLPGPAKMQNKSLPVPEAPRLPVFSEKYQSCIISRKLACNVDHGVVGLMDPAHGPFVHQAWWWRGRNSIHAKAKAFEPIPNGFRMSAHTPSNNSAAYKLLNVYNEPVVTTIDFVLPSRRYELIRCGPYWFSTQTVVTPITAEECRLDISAAWNIFPWLPFAKSIYRIFANMFVGQDQQIMEKQAVGLKDNPSLMLIDDADTQAKWYYRLKAAYLESQRAGTSLDHPLKEPVTLRWRS